MLATIGTIRGSIVQYPDPVIVVARLEGELPITDLGISAFATDPHGTVLPIDLRDDGVSPDGIGSDGLYTAFLPQDSAREGDFRLTAHFDNDAGTATFTSLGRDHKHTFNLVGANFHRVATASVSVIGVKSDDHANTPAGATNLEQENIPQSGRIDYSNDLDLFKITAPQTGQIVIRVTGIAMGMDPQLRVLGDDSVTELGRAVFVPASGDYPRVTLDVKAGDVLFAEVIHIKGRAGYQCHPF